MNSQVYYIPSPTGIGVSCTSSNSYECIRYPHYHTNYELSTVVSGVHSVVLERDTLNLQTGDVVLLRPNEVHTRILETPGKHVTVAFPEEEFNAALIFLESGISTSPFEQARPLTAKLSESELDRMVRRIERLNFFCATNPQRAIAELRTLLVTLCYDHLLTTDNVDSEAPPWLTKLMYEMKKPENIRQGLSAMRKLTPYTHGYLCREFKRTISCTPTEYINNARLDLALKLLVDPEQNIVDICYFVGFESISYFYHLFKSKFGCTPNRYRKTHYISHPDVPIEQFSTM